MEKLSSELLKGKGIRLFAGFLFLISLTFFLHFRKEPAQLLEYGTVASHFITSQVEFEFADREATELLKQEAVKDVGPIYAAQMPDVKKRCLEVEDQLRNEQAWRENFPEVPFEKILQSIEVIETALLKARHTDARTFHRIQFFYPKEGSLFLSSPLNEGKLPERFWQMLDESIRIKIGLDEKSSNFILSFFSDRPWQWDQDWKVEKGFRENIEQSIPVKRTRVKAGSHIITPGEKVTHRHMDMFSAMKRAVNKEKDPWHPLPLLGSLVFSSLFTLSAAAYLRGRHLKIYKSAQQLSILVSIILLSLLFFKLEEHFLFGPGKIFSEHIRYPLVIPFATILISVFIGWEIALFASLFLTVAIALSVSGDQVRIFIFNILSSFVALLCGAHLHKRREVFVVCGKIFLSTLPILVAFHLWDQTLWSPAFLTDLGSSFGFLFFTAALAVGFLTIVESLVPVVTDMALVEYMDPHHPLLRRLTVEAPGTYQHSLVVGSLAESAARAIDASGLFCRVSALYHDIGKLFNPHYFSENQLGGFNMHQLLTPIESAQVIIAHVTEGERLARKHRLPPPFIDIIREHHGTQLVYYFYAKEKEQSSEPVDEKRFRYPGPKPCSKESAIIMIADTVEAASRALEEVSEESIKAMVERLVDEKVRDAQLEQCELTFDELERVKISMIHSLVAANHLRIKYPLKTET
jgi:putative nucleotidyltransferase with HDIG domain